MLIISSTANEFGAAKHGMFHFFLLFFFFLFFYYAMANLHLGRVTIFRRPSNSVHARGGRLQSKNPKEGAQNS
jgi:hypothetical protein